MLDGGGRVVQETRGWNEDDGTTYSLRSKEEAQDYRYFPDPDLPPLVLDDALVAEVEATMPELPRGEARALRRRDGAHARTRRRCSPAHPRVAAFFEEAATLHGRRR